MRAVPAGKPRVGQEDFADKDALAGLNKGVTCELTFNEAGQTFKLHSGSGVLRVDEARVAEAVK